MASVVLKMSVSLDGFAAPLDRSTGWSEAGRSPDGAAWTLETVRNAQAHVIGAATYTEWTTFWPHAPGPFAEPMNELPKFVFSNSLTAAEWGPTTIVSGDLAEQLSWLKDECGDGYLLAQGGVRFARSLVSSGLVDEFRLVVHPVVLGCGEALFTEALAIEPVETIPFSRGAVAHVFTARR